MHLSIGGGLKVFPVMLKGGPKFLHKSERGDENSIKYLRMSSTPSPARINDPSLTMVIHKSRNLIGTQGIAEFGPK